mgnify:CR=1 FL=1
MKGKEPNYILNIKLNRYKCITSIQYIIIMSKQKTNVENPEEEVWVVVDQSSNPIYNDDEGKFEDDTRTGIGSEFYKERSFAQNYLKSSAAKGMDDVNKKAMKVLANKGPEVAVNYMMHQAGGDYGTMRSMYG